MQRIAHTVVHVLHRVREILLEVDRVINGTVLCVDLLLLRDELLLNRSREKLIGVLLRVNLEKRGRIDLCEKCVLRLLAWIG